MTPALEVPHEQKRINEQEIISYYDDCQVDYEIVWHLKSKMCMHYGYWDKTTRRLRDALTNMNRKVAEFARIAPGETILDAGCGVGGMSIFLARQYRCQTVGITLSEKQVRTATENASRHDVALNCRFERQNYLTTTFPDNSFDAVVGLESICYAYDKADFLREAFRVLKPGGRVMIADFFSNGVLPDTDEARLMQKWTATWAIKSYADNNEFWETLSAVGFVNCQQQNVTDHVVKSIRRLYYSFFPGVIVTKLLQWVGIRNQTQTDNTWSTRYQYKAYQQNLWQYRFYCAEKPNV
ncbi:methyltransferase domain-containing protein [Spirosoma aureum]|uniref:Methyltransferase domain-containing protein n=1 Tax=Spirosoma aureum TaxID=2692134 RepID=A0A6G9AX73_9BACT|nr:methyltransferase domain-containing protein [Spirosoma aureum]QIP16974.1 methyltransferase domain-containing protein [Spirosoma aureum]